MAEPEGLWGACVDGLRERVPPAVWQSCFAATSVVPTSDNRLVLAVPSSLVKERIEQRWLTTITDVLHDLGARDVTVELTIRPDEPTELFPGIGGFDAAHAASASVPSEDRRDGHAPAEVDDYVGTPGPESLGPSMSATPLDVRIEAARRDRQAKRDSWAPSLNARYTFDAFVTGSSNHFAHAAALAVAETPARSFNPLFIYGVAGLGKTHLLHAIAHYVHEHYPAYNVRYVSTEAFMNDFVEAIRTNTTAAFKRRYREADVLLVDDIQFMEGKEGLQEEFFYTFNELHGANRQIVLSSDRPPRAIATLEERLRSRFEWGLITDIQPPDLETRLAILRKKAEREATPVPGDVLEFIADRATANIRELEGALIRVSAFASLNRTVPTVAMASEVLADILNDSKPRVITAKMIIQATAEQFDFSVDELCSKSRRRPLVTARQIGMYVTREMTDLSYPAIARDFGGRDHTTVIHAVEKIGALMKERRQIYDQVTDLMQVIRAGG